MRLTDLSIRKLRAPDSGQKTYFDDALPGFGIRVSQGGTKSYVVMYGIAHLAWPSAPRRIRNQSRNSYAADREVVEARIARFIAGT